MPARMWRHGTHSFLELSRRREHLRDLSQAARGPVSSQKTMQLWSQRFRANSTSKALRLESRTGEKPLIIHRQVPCLIFYSFVRLRRGSAWLTLRLLRDTSGGQLAQEERPRAGAAERLRDFEEDIDLALVSSDHAGSRERQESRIERCADAVMLVDQLIPHGAEAVEGEAQPNHGQTEALRGVGAQF
ncbi:hypothetical protein CSPX01_07713 [Colletotrichum filicis]|nr:hypothetical protein CSPX01_07713 [Colletotrichum filicis]